MSRADFQDRLQRIGAQEPNSHFVASPGSNSKPTGRQTVSHVHMLMGAAFIAGGLQAVKHALQNHEALRDSGATGTLAGLAIGGGLALLFGAKTMMRGMPDKHAAVAAAQTARQPSARARIFFSILGFAFGSLACLYMFLVAAARFVDTEKAHTFATGGVVIAAALALVSLSFGLAGLFLRGYALGRVPVYFLIGGIVTWSFVRIARINMLEWSVFMAQLQ